MRPYTECVSRLLAELGISETYLAGRGLALQEQASLLMPLGVDLLGRDQFATPEAGLAWIAMRQAALDAGVELQLVSAFRSIDYQAGIIRRKLAGGLDLNTILQVSAAPGYSEHHTGRAFDVSSPDSAVLEESFEHSVGFAWLSHNAARFGFVMSLPRDNAAGYIYEPWHWLYQPTSSTMT